LREANNPPARFVAPLVCTRRIAATAAAFPAAVIMVRGSAAWTAWSYTMMPTASRADICRITHSAVDLTRPSLDAPLMEPLRSMARVRDTGGREASRRASGMEDSAVMVASTEVL